jgi:hypothetical protein
MAAKTTPRFGRINGQVYYAERISQVYSLIPAGTAIYSWTPNAYDSIVAAQAALTSALTINAVITKSQLGDRANFLFLGDATGRTVTFGTDFIPTATLAVGASKRASASFQFDGVKWVETGRAVQP